MSLHVLMTWLFYFLLGMLARMIYDSLLRFIEHYYEMKDIYDAHQRKLNACPHGWEDWDNCPDCRH